MTCVTPERQGKTDAEIAKFSKLFTEVQQQIDSKQLRPMIRTQYLRTAFQVRPTPGCLGFEELSSLSARLPGARSRSGSLCACVRSFVLLQPLSNDSSCYIDYVFSLKNQPHAFPSCSKGSACTTNLFHELSCVRGRCSSMLVAGGVKGWDTLTGMLRRCRLMRRCASRWTPT